MKLNLSSTHCQVFLLASPLPRPFHRLAIHSWLVTNSPGVEVARWEVWQKKYRCPESWGYVHKNLLPLEAGMNEQSLTRGSSKRWEAEVLGVVEGKEAEVMIRFIQRFAPRYPFAQWYFLWPGPNSNTFVQWILNTFPKVGLSLPQQALGAKFYSRLVTLHPQF